MRLRSHVLIIAAATLLPIIAIVCLAVVLLFQKGRDIELDNLVDTARALSLAVDRDFETGLASLRALATTQELRTGDLRTFYNESKRAIAVHEGAEAVILVDPSGQQIINTRRPYGDPLPKYGDLVFIKKVVESGRPTVSNLFIGRIIQRAMISVGVPVVLDGQVKYALTLSLSPGSLQQLVVQQGIAADSEAVIIDANKIIVARTREVDKYLGKPVSPTATAKSAETIEGWWEGLPQEGLPSYAAHHRSRFSGWTVVLGVPKNKINAPLWEALQYILGGIFLTLVAAFGLATVLGRRITASIAALSAGANALGSGQNVRIMPSPVFELDQVGQQLESASAKRKEMESSLRQSESRLRAIIDTEPECVKVVAPDGKLVDINAAGLRMLQAESLEAIGNNNLLDFVAPAHREAFVNLHQRVMNGESATLEFEIVGLKGGQLWLETRAAPLRDPAGRVTALLGVTRDITERKRAEEALRAVHDELERRVEERTAQLSEANDLLRKSEEWLNQAIEVAHLGIFEHNFLNDEVTYSLTLKSMIDWPADLAPSTNEFLRRVYPDDREQVAAAIRQAHDPTGDGHLAIDYRIVRQDGTISWLLVRSQIFFDGIGAAYRPIRGVGAALDITERKRAEEKLTATKNLLQKVMDSSPDWIFAKDLDHRFLFVNRAFAEAQSLTPDDMIGKLDTEFWSEELCEGNTDKGIRGFHEDDRAAFRGDVVHNPVDPATYADGSVHIFDTYKSPMRDEAGRIFGVLCYCRDTTERKQSEEALRASEERLQHALTVGSMGVWERDLRTGKVQWDRRNFELLGIEAEKSVDLEMLFSRIHPDDMPVVKSALERTQSTGEVYVSEYRILKSDGKIIWLHANGGLRRDRDGAPTHIAGINFDITERKRAEAALRKLTDDLDRRVVARTGELAESQARLRALVAQLSRAEERERRRLAVELHDYLAQMLTISRLKIGRASMLAADDAMKKRLAEAQESVDDSIAYTRTLMAQLSPRVLYDLGLPAALAWLGTQQKERHGLDVDLSGEAEEFVLDEERSVLAYQCVRELLWNIVKHAETNQATVSYALEQGELTVEVADDGRGFDLESFSANGNGMEKFGLFSIRERLELFGGKLEVTSRPGHGTRARFSLPARQIQIAPTVTQNAALVSAAMAVGKRLSVALVDDHEVVRRGLRQLLEEFADLTVVGEANDGLEGIKLARQFSPDVVVMDVNMPGMNGIEATKLIVQEMPSTIVVGLSFESDTQITQAMKAAGAFTCVTKERAVEDIHQAIMDAVEGRRRVMAH